MAVDDADAEVQRIVLQCHVLADEAGLKPAALTAAGTPPQAFRPAGTSARKGPGALELLPIYSAADVFPKAVPRGQSLPFTHTISVTFPHSDQPLKAAVPAGCAAQLFDFTCVVKEDAPAAGGSRASRVLAAQQDKAAVMNGIKVAAAVYRSSAAGDPATGTPPFAKIMVRPTLLCCTAPAAASLDHSLACSRACLLPPCPLCPPPQPPLISTAGHRSRAREAAVGIALFCTAAPLRRAAAVGAAR